MTKFVFDARLNDAMMKRAHSQGATHLSLLSAALT